MDGCRLKEKSWQGLYPPKCSPILSTIEAIVVGVNQCNALLVLKKWFAPSDPAFPNVRHCGLDLVRTRTHSVLPSNHSTRWCMHGVYN